MELALQRRVIRRVIRQFLQDDELDSEFVTVDAVIRFAREGSVGGSLQWSGDLRMRIDYNSLVFEYSDDELPIYDYLLIADERDVVLGQWETVTEFGWEICISANPKSEFSTEIYLPDDCSITIRGREQGERFRPRGMGGNSRKLKDWMIDKKIPRYLRDQIPLVIVDGEVGAIVCNESLIIADDFADRGAGLGKYYVSVVKARDAL